MVAEPKQAMRDARIDRAMRQLDVAFALEEQTGDQITENTVSRWEHGRASIPKEIRPILAKILSIDEELLND